ncbi:MAG: metallophosphoesterase [Lachnoclostridium sp.]|nr:metallophosphoesterase [Lachnoclostridium sp.]
MAILLLLMLAIIGGGAYYLSKRFSQFFPILSFKKWLLIFLCTTIAFVAGSLVFADSASLAGGILFYPGTIWVSILLYLLISLLVVDLINLVIKIRPLIRGVIVLSITSIIVIYGFINASVIRVNEVTIPVSGLKEDITAVQITDVHLGNFWGKENLKEIVNKVNECNPDVVLNTGDFFETAEFFTEDSDALEPLKQIKVPHYFVHGNHDGYVGVEEAVKYMSSMGVIVLRNEVANFGELQIVGLDNMQEDENENNAHTAGPGTVKDIMNQLPIDEERPTIVLHHRPSGVSYMNEKKADVLLSGHTHGGQLFPMALIQEFTQPFNKGLHKFEDMSVYVSQGVGSLFPYIRVGTHSEITLIKFVPESASHTEE